MKKDNKPLRCVGVIMDGNRRWARERGLKPRDGHKEGYEVFKKLIKWAKNANIENVVVYAFSTENWKRSESEKKFLFSLIKKMSKNDLKEIAKEGVRLRFIGEKERFQKDLFECLKDAEEKTLNNKEINVWVALSYGGRSEIISAINSIIAKSPQKQKITEEEFSKNLWTQEMPDPDIIIRPGGEKRLSNFLPWQSVYSELFFVDTYWPDFNEKHFKNIISKYFKRERRKGA